MSSGAGRRRFKSVFAGVKEVIEAKFRLRLNEFFGRYIDMKSPERTIDWDCIVLSALHFCGDGTLFEDNVRSKLYFDFVFNLFEEFRCVDKSAIDSCLFQYERYRTENYSNLRYLLFTTRPMYAMPLPQFAILMQDLSFPVFRAFLLRDIVGVRRLIRYGELCDLVDVGDEYLSQYLEYTLDRLLEFPYGPYICSPIDSYDRYHSDARCSGRLIFHIMMIDTLIQNRKAERNHRDTVQNLKLIFKATTEPYITVAEVQRILRIYLKKSNGGGVDEARVQEFCDIFLELFPRGGTRGLQPRTLKHLSRIQVRENLNLARKLPHGVWALEIPKPLMNYVVFQ